MEKKQSRQFALMFVDDEISILTSLKRVFRKSPYDLYTAQNGVEALEVLKSTPIDAALVDLLMPQMNGMEVFESLCRDESTKGIPVIMVTGIREKAGINFNIKDMEKLYGEKPKGYIEKPVVPRELVKKVKKFL